MTEEMYRRILGRIRSNDGICHMALTLMRILTHGTVAAFIAMLAALAANRQFIELYHAVLVCGVSFIAVSIFRKAVGAKRPYEVYDIEPLEAKETRGNSFPSRHVFSIFIIAMTFLKLNTALGIIFLIMGVMLAVLRVISGLHFIRDVVCGAALGVVIGILGYWVIF